MARIKQHVSLRLPSEMVSKLKKMADKESRSFNNMTEIVIDNALKDIQNEN
tara:strand:+ start:787 stop:939 length:153 start_codon:yes stop_codon:yes gene_type:complete